MKSVTDFQLPGNLQASAVFSLQIFMQRTEFSGLFMERVEYLSQWRMVHTMERDLLLESTCLVVELWGGGGATCDWQGPFDLPLTQHIAGTIAAEGTTDRHENREILRSWWPW